MVIDEVGLQPLEAGGVIRVEHRAGAALLGQVVELGYTHIDLDGYVIVSAEPVADEPGRHAVRLEPGSEKSAQIFEHLHKLATGTKPKTSRPPPPPRKGKGNRGGTRKKRR
jgi:hypothetical protein